jgi:hypothetical protein
MRKATKKTKLALEVQPISALPAPKSVLFLPIGRGASGIGALILVLVTLTSLAACVLFYLRTSQAISYTVFAGDELQIANHRMGNLQNRMNVFEKTLQSTAGKIVTCDAEAIPADKNGDARLVCATAGGDKKVLLTSIRTAFKVNDNAYAPVVSAYLASGGSTVYIISGVKGNADAYHVWTYDLTSGATADLSGK